MAGLTEFYCGWNEPSHASQFKWLEYTFKCFGTAQRAVPHAEEDRNEGAPNLRAAEAVDVEVERKVHQLQIVGHRAEHLRIPGNIWLNMKLDLQSLFGLRVHSCTHWLRPRIWAHIRGRYWSAKIDDISL